jgi:hypothetical protein
MRGSRETADPKTAAHPLHAAALVCAIATPLVLAAWLERDPASTSTSRSITRPSVVPPPASTPAAAQPIAPVARPAEPAPDVETAPPVDLAQRTRADARRLGAAGQFTLQFAVMCRDENVREILAGMAADPNLYVLAATIDGRSCHRVCYGAYRSADQAAGDRSVPRALDDLTSAPRPVRVAQVLP